MVQDCCRKPLRSPGGGSHSTIIHLGIFICNQVWTRLGRIKLTSWWTELFLNNLTAAWISQHSSEVFAPPLTKYMFHLHDFTYIEMCFLPISSFHFSFCNLCILLLQNRKTKPITVFLGISKSDHEWQNWILRINTPSVVGQCVESISRMLFREAFSPQVQFLVVVTSDIHIMVNNKSQ